MKCPQKIYSDNSDNKTMTDFWDNSANKCVWWMF